MDIIITCDVTSISSLSVNFFHDSPIHVRFISFIIKPNHNLLHKIIKTEKSFHTVHTKLKTDKTSSCVCTHNPNPHSSLSSPFCYAAPLGRGTMRGAFPSPCEEETKYGEGFLSFFRSKMKMVESFYHYSLYLSISFLSL